MKSLSSEVEYKATALKWKEFLESDIWHDLQLFLADKAEYQTSRLIITEEERRMSEKMPETDDIIRGRLRETSDLLMAPQEIYNELLEQGETEEPTDQPT